MKSAIILQGIGEATESFWLPWLKKELEVFNRETYKLQKKYLDTIQSGIMEFVNS